MRLCKKEGLGELEVGGEGRPAHGILRGTNQGKLSANLATGSMFFIYMRTHLFGSEEASYAAGTINP